jgi:16S rRNA (guanine966-N2)-methyltransferase
VRVIGGSCRGRVLRAPAAIAIRPTSDRVREAIFDILGSLVDLHGFRVADLFAGSGAMGIEALSRGAASVFFVDRDRAAIDAVRRNLASTGLAGPAAQVIHEDVLSWLLRRRQGPDVPVHLDLALCDPPYAFHRWDELLARLPADWAVLESDREVPIPAGWEAVRQRRYGGTLVEVIRPTLRHIGDKRDSRDHRDQHEKGAL